MQCHGEATLIFPLPLSPSSIFRATPTKLLRELPSYFESLNTSKTSPTKPLFKPRGMRDSHFSLSHPLPHPPFSLP
jgi:hypothetical protein